MKRFFFFALFLCSQQFLIAQEFEWVKTFPIDKELKVNATTLDDQFNIISIMEATFSGGFDFDPGPEVADGEEFSGTSSFIHKLDSAGNFIWVKTLSALSPGSKVRARFVKTDTANNIYVGGVLIGDADFDSGPGSYIESSAGAWDSFLVKYDPDGNFQWVQTVGDGSFETISGLSIGTDGVYITAIFDGTIDFDPGPGTFIATANPEFFGKDLFVRKVDFDGNFEWVKTFDTYDDEKNGVLHVDQDDNLYIHGYFKDSIDSDPTIDNESILVKEGGGFGYFVTRLNADGSFSEAFLVDTYNYRITSDEEANVYFVGSFNGEVDLDPGLGEDIHSTEDKATFITKLSPGFSFIWSYICGEDEFLNINGISIDPIGHCYATGFFFNENDFASGLEVAIRTSLGILDGYLLHLDQDGNFVEVQQMGAVDSDNIRSVLCTPFDFLIISGNYTGLNDLDMGEGEELYEGGGVDGDQGNPFIQRLSYECYDYSNADTTFIVTCDSYVWPETGEIYTESGIHKVRLKDVTDCDSILVLDYSRRLDSLSEIITSCNEFTWAVNGTTYFESGDYSEIFVNELGCDSVMSLNLTVNANDLSIVRDGLTLKVNTWVADSYQWLDCEDEFSEITDANSQEFDVTQNGSYAIIVEKLGCIDTSDCFIVEDLSIAKVNKSVLEFLIYPNPVIDVATIKYDLPINQIFVLVIQTMDGKLVREYNLPSGKSIQEIDLRKLENGLYNISLITNENVVVHQRILVNSPH